MLRVRALTDDVERLERLHRGCSATIAALRREQSELVQSIQMATEKKMHTQPPSRKTLVPKNAVTATNSPPNNQYVLSFGGDG